MATRVFELARELDVTSKVILAKCRAEGLDVKNHMSLLSGGLVAAIREWSGDRPECTGVATPERVELPRAQAGALKPAPVAGSPPAGGAAVGRGPAPEKAEPLRASAAPDGAIQTASRPAAVPSELADADERVAKGLKLLASGLGPFVKREMSSSAYGSGWERVAIETLADGRSWARNKTIAQILRDPLDLLNIIDKQWGRVFRKLLGKRVRSWVVELREDRHKSAHNEPFSPEEAYRTLDSIRLLLGFVWATEEVPSVRELMRELLPLL